MPTLGIGDGAPTANNLVPFSVRPGDTVTINCLSGSTSSVTVLQNGVDQAGTAVTAGNNLAVSIAGPYWLQAAPGGVATVQIVGGLYGAV